MKINSLFVYIFILIFLSCSSLPTHTTDEFEINAEGQKVIKIKNEFGIETDIHTKTEIETEIGKVVQVSKPVTYTLTFTAVGDNLYHNSMLTSALSNGVYDFTPNYTEIKNIVTASDIAFINQETPMAKSRPFAGYPVFNSPPVLAHTLVETGFTVFNYANNHALDTGAAGLYETLDFLDTIKEITVIGARRSGESARILTKNNISLGFLAYTFGINGVQLPANNPNLVSLINRTKMKQEIEALRPLCDFLIVSMHWGDEYMLSPSKEQVDLAVFLAELNVDLIIGHHPHVLQKADTITLPNGRKTVVFYSLGNLVTHQLEWERLIGGMAVVTFTKEGIESADGEITWTGERGIADFGMLPLVTHIENSFRKTKIYPLYSYTNELLAVHSLRTRPAGPIKIDFFHNVLKRLNVKIFTNNPFENPSEAHH